LSEKNFTKKLQATREFQWPPPIWEYQEVFELVTNGRMVCVTERGYFGLVRDRAQLGDEVCVVIGCDVPMVMRQSDLDKEKRVLVGDAFVLDLMDGQALAMEGAHVRDIILQ
jgi:hypothetical protein